MANGTYQVRFEGLQHAGGLYNRYAFQVTPPDAAQAYTQFVEISTNLQIRLWQEYDTEHDGIMQMAACAVSLHLGGLAPGEAYRDEERTTLYLGTKWYPGHPDEPRLLSNFEAFEVPAADTPPGSPPR